MSAASATIATLVSPLRRHCHQIRKVVRPSWMASSSASGSNQILRIAWTYGWANPDLGRGSFGYSHRLDPSGYSPTSCLSLDWCQRASSTIGFVKGSSSVTSLDTKSAGSSPPKCDQARKVLSKMDVRCSNSWRRDMIAVQYATSSFLGHHCTFKIICKWKINKKGWVYGIQSCTFLRLDLLS